MACNSEHLLAPNTRLQLTRAALLLQSVRGERASSGALGRVQLNRQPLGR
jgi:hypothetical protein